MEIILIMVIDNPVVKTLTFYNCTGVKTQLNDIIPIFFIKAI